MQIIQCLLADFSSRQHIMIYISCSFIQIFQLPNFWRFKSLLKSGLIFQRIARIYFDIFKFSNSINSLYEIQVFKFHDKLKNISAASARKTVKKLFLLIDWKRRRLFSMERTKTHPVFASMPHLNEVADNIQNICIASDHINRFFGYSASQKIPSRH